MLVGHKGVEVIERDTVVDLAVRMDFVDTELASVREIVRSLVEEDIGFDIHPAVVRSFAGEDIDLETGHKELAVADRKAPAGHRELAGRKKVVGGLDPDLRNSRCLT